MTMATSVPAEPVTVREVLRLFWEADRYPILGSADARDASALEREALAKAKQVIPLHDDPPEFMQWLNILSEPSLTNDRREIVHSALRDHFELTGDVS